MNKFLFTIIGLLFLIFLFLFWGGSVFTKMSVENTISSLRDSINFQDKEFFEYSNLDDQPELISNFFKSVIKDNCVIPKFITVEQNADFKTDINSAWLPLSAIQYYTTKQPSYLWNSEMQTSQFFWVNAIESYINGKGNMLIKFNSSVTIADSWGIELDKSGMFRYISEAVIFPTKLMPDKNLLWNILDSNLAEIKFIHNENSVVFKVFFNEKNRIFKIETYDKYRAQENGYKKSLYTVYFSDYKLFNNSFFVPTYLEFEWDLPSGKFKYGKFNIVDITYE